MAMIEKTFTNNELEIKLTSYIENKQDIWFKRKEVAKILGYHDADDALRRHVSDKYKKEAPQNYPVKRRGTPKAIFITELGFYEPVFMSKLPIAVKFRDWVYEKVLPHIRKYG